MGTAVYGAVEEEKDSTPKGESPPQKRRCNPLRGKKKQFALCGNVATTGRKRGGNMPRPPSPSPSFHFPVANVACNNGWRRKEMGEGKGESIASMLSLPLFPSSRSNSLTARYDTPSFGRSGLQHHVRRTFLHFCTHIYSLTRD